MYASALRFRFVLAVVCCGLASTASTPRTGFVTLQYDDSNYNQFNYIFNYLQSHGFKASFGYITEASDLGIEHWPSKMVQIYQAGHEVQDHTTRHDYLWATHVDTLQDGQPEWIPYTFADVATWDSLCERSLFILDSLGISVTGFNQPGGSGLLGGIPDHPEWRWLGAVNDSLYSLIASKYSYAIGYGVSPKTAHLNLRGHNFPDRFPFFNVPHTNIEGMDLADVKTDIADAVASGLWYIALSHARTTEEIEKARLLMIWLDDEDIEVMRCDDGVERVLNGQPDRYANQLPQAAMLHDRDGNGKPDGFTGECSWDTTSAVPVEGCNSMVVSGDVEFICYGPEAGRNAFSVWMKRAGGASGALRIVWTAVDFDWQYLDERWNTVSPDTAWVLVDSTVCADLIIDVGDDVDRIYFNLKPDPGLVVEVACPSLLLTADAGVRPGDCNGAMPTVLRVVPNPVEAGLPVTVLGSGFADIYDVLGRRVGLVRSAAGAPRVVLDTAGLAPGVYLVLDGEGGCAPAKMVICK